MRLLGEPADRVLRVVSGRQSVFRAGEGVLAAAEQKALAQLLSLFLGLRDESRDDVAEVFRSGLVAVSLRFFRVVLPQIARGTQRSSKSEIRIRMFRAPQDGFGTQRARNPHRRIRLLVGQRPRIDVAIMEVLALVAPRPGL